MAYPLNAILNPVNGSAQTNPEAIIIQNDTLMNDGTKISQASTGNLDEEEDLLGECVSRTNNRIRYQRNLTEDNRVPLAPTQPKIANDPLPSLYEPQSRNSNIFSSLLKYPELTLEFSKQLEIEDLISLYAISKEFHFLINSRYTAMILGQSNTKASESSKTFIFRCYKSLCMRDPARRPNETKPDELRFIPSFRWLRMILFRETVVDDILRSLAEEGHRLPKPTRLTIKKIWFTIDISDNARRIGLMHNTAFWSNKDLFLATMFFIKLDMRLTHPTAGNGEIGLRKMLLGQRSLSTLSRVLRREEMRTQVDMLRMIVKFNYEPPRHRQMDIMGVPSHEIGRLQYEGWGARGTKFVQIDELVMREGVKRKLNLQNYHVDMMIYGYIDKQTFQDIKTPMRKQVDGVEEDGQDDTSSDEFSQSSFGLNTEREE